MPATSDLTGWPVRLTRRRPDGSVLVLRPLERRDKGEWESLRERNAAWLEPWEATLPGEAPGTKVPFRLLLRALRRSGGASRMLPFVMELDGRMAGPMWLCDIQWGSLCSGSAGYWVDEALAGQGVAPLGLAMLTDYALVKGGLHRVEVNVQPHNAASLRVVEKVGFRDEGVRRAFQYVEGGWRDHRTYALTAEDPGVGRLADRLVSRAPDSDVDGSDLGGR